MGVPDTPRGVCPPRGAMCLPAERLVPVPGTSPRKLVGYTEAKPSDSAQYGRMTLWHLLTVAAAGVGLVIIVVMAVIPFIADEPRGFHLPGARRGGPLDSSGRRPSAT